MRLTGCLYLLAFAPSALAAQPLPFAEVDTHGGFSLYDEVAHLAAVVDQGAPVGGEILVSRSFHSGPTLQMTDSMPLFRTRSLFLAGRAADPGSATDTWTPFQNVDLANVDVTFLGVTQTVHQNEAVFPVGSPQTTPEMSAFIDMVNDEIYNRVVSAPRFEYHAAGGQLGYERTISIAQGGYITDTTTYVWGGVDRHATGVLDAQTVMELQGLAHAAHWPWLTGWSGHPSWVDGIDEEATVCRFGECHSVWGGYYWERTPEYQDFLDAVIAAGDALP